MRRQIAEMLRLQNEVNIKINPGWLSAGYPFLRAVLVEAVEAIEHHGWKWWSKQEPHLEQLSLELIDIWHFALSHVLIQQKGDIEAAAGFISDGWRELDAQELASFEISEGSSLLERLEAIAGLATRREFSVPLFRSSCASVGLAFDALFTRYVGKNALNHFRQDNGYKSGAYRKSWSGREDNEHLSEVLSQISDTEPEQLKGRVYEALRSRYQHSSI